MSGVAVRNFRADERSERALVELMVDGSTTSDAIHQALVDAVRLRRREQMRAESLEVLDDLMLSTVLVAPTSRSSAPRIFRPTIALDGDETWFLIEQTSAVERERLGEFVGRLSPDGLEAIDEALRLVLELD